MAKLRITQIKSKIGKTKRQKRTIQALGLRKINHSIEVQDNPQILGMLNKVNHIILIEKI